MRAALSWNSAEQSKANKAIAKGFQIKSLNFKENGTERAKAEQGQ